MLDWLKHLLRQTDREHERSPEVQEAQRQQKRDFDAWKVAKAEVRRVERLADRCHAGMHRPHR